MAAWMNRCVVAMAVVCFVMTAATASAAPVSVEGKPVEVTLYRGQAQVTRAVSFKGDKGPMEVVVTGLPQHVVGSSLFAEAGDGVEVRAVRYRRRAVGEDTREEVRKIDQRLRELSDQMQLVRQRQQVLEERKNYIAKLENFTAGTGKSDLEKGALDAEALTKMTLFIFEQREQIAERTIELNREQREIQEKINLAQRQRSQIASGSVKYVQEAVVFVEKRDAGNAALRLTYLVNHCGWSPAYNFRADQAKGQVQIEYNALVRQMSGEDWSDVELRLSTASPALSAAGPGIAPFFVSLQRSAPGQQGQAAQGPQGVAYDYANTYKKARQSQYGAMAANAQAFTQSDQAKAGWDINDVAAQVQAIELNASEEVLERVREHRPVGPSLSYTIAKPVSLASRADQQMIRIVDKAVATSFYYVASPVLTEYVYREATMTNTTGSDLLNGPVNVYLDGRFVGRTELVTVAQGQTFVLGFGVDPQLKATRELVDRDESVQGANRVLQFDYRLVLENFKNAPAQVRVYDRLPHHDKSRDLRITLADDLSHPLSKDEVYLRRERPTGILRWDVKVPAKAAGSKAEMIKYSYRLEFDRNLTLGTPTGQEKQEAERIFKELEQQRRLQ